MLRVSTAAHSGVRPYQSAALMSAPRSISSRATSIRLLTIAVSSGVMALASVRLDVGAGCRAAAWRSRRGRRAPRTGAATGRRESARASRGPAGRRGRCRCRDRSRARNWAAPSSGVAPTRVFAFTCAPRAMSRRATSLTVFAHGEHQRRLLKAFLAGVGHRAAVEQQPDGVEHADFRRRHQRRFAGRIGGVRIGAGVEQRAEHRHVAAAGGDRQRRQTEPVRPASRRRRTPAAAARSRDRRSVPPSAAPACRRCPER